MQPQAAQIIFQKSRPKLNSLNGSSAMATLSSGSCSGNERSITSVSVNCRVSSGSSRYTLYVISPDGTTLSKSCGTSSTSYTFTGFNGEDPKGIDHYNRIKRCSNYSNSDTKS